ncbi:RHS repeat-associated core domain-containing protein [Anaerocolumna jejuensis DSM 15929]|uniref:RHS repeat-associated core domain-containing protein n=1 Tax=Anaerocolumna jejuensis DSM 15929 TaxID=1121322 RepID=A0A1M7DPL7_9FIRM|nr:RHS repeat-associated core domain-containing protein [Anaerocolumna jejuensis DSM 15929]
MEKVKNQSLYAEESCEQKTHQYKNVIRFLWSGNTLLHEWEVGEEGKRKLRERAGEKADYLLKIEDKADQKARAEAEKGSEPPNGLITWVFQGDFIPRAKLTEEDTYSIISDYLGTPVEAYDEEGKKVWERELDIYGRVKDGLKDKYGRSTVFVGEDGFIPFRYQGQYHDLSSGLYYNHFRYYDPEIGQYTQQDPIGLYGNNPTSYGYVHNPNSWIDPFGLHEILKDIDIVVRGGQCSSASFINGSGVVQDALGKLSGISTQASSGAGLAELAQVYQHNQVGVATVGAIEKAGGTITLDGKLNSTNGTMMANHATVDGLTAQQAEDLFTPTQKNPVPKELRGC